ncbi:MAG: DHH family phosphoesterase [Bacillota bacterium]
MDSQAGLRQVASAIRSHNSFVVLTHEKPDGDAVGSGLAMVLALQALGKQAILVTSDPLPAVYDFLPGKPFHTRAAYLEPADFSPEAALFLDCTDPERAGAALRFAEGKFLINIDHHVSNSGFGDVRLVRPDASATGEIVYGVLEALGVEISSDIATCLYVAIVTDTGGFRYQNTTGTCLRIAAALLDKGVSAWSIAEQVFETRSVSSVLLLASALSTLKLHRRGKVASIFVTKEMMMAAGASPEETEGIIGYPRSLTGVEVALLFKEDPEGRGFHVSMRSRSKVDVAEVAVSLGGGGHPRAAGALIPGDLAEVTAKVLSKLDSLPWMDS